MDATQLKQRSISNKWVSFDVGIVPFVVYGLSCLLVDGVPPKHFGPEPNMANFFWQKEKGVYIFNFPFLTIPIINAVIDTECERSMNSIEPSNSWQIIYLN